MKKYWQNSSHTKINSFLPFPDDHHDILLEGNESFTFQTMSFGTLIYYFYHLINFESYLCHGSEISGIKLTDTSYISNQKWSANF